MGQGIAIEGLRVALLAVAGTALLWLSFANSVSLVLGRTAPELGLKMGLPSAEAKATEAVLIAIEQPSPTADQQARAARLAREALRREPVNVAAPVALGTLATLRHDPAAGALFAYAERLSRRNLLAELWLLQDRVDHGDIPGALIHYDRAMRVTPALRPTLIPILVQAARDPAVARALAAVMARRPAWWGEALGALILQSPDPAGTLPILLRAFHLRTDNDVERTLLAAAITRLAEAGAIGQAYGLYVQAGGTRTPGPERVRHSDFMGENRLPPFDWELHTQDGRSAVIQPGGTGRALFLYADADHQGEMASQLLLLGPGRYRLSVRAGNITGDDFQRPTANITCAGHRMAPLATLRLLPSGDTGRLAVSDIVVPAGCPTQWLSIAVGGVDTQTQDPARIDTISVRPVE